MITVTPDLLYHPFLVYTMSDLDSTTSTTPKFWRYEKPVLRDQDQSTDHGSEFSQVSVSLTTPRKNSVSVWSRKQTVSSYNFLSVGKAFTLFITIW